MHLRARKPAARRGRTGCRQRGARPRRRALALALALAVVLSASAAIAAPLIEVKSRAQLKLDGVIRRGSDAVEVRGRLFDPATSLGLPEQVVEVQVGDVVVRGTTDAEGRFTAEAPAGPGAQAIALTFAGNVSVDQAALQEEADPSRRAVTLTFAAAETEAGVALTVTARSDGVELSAPLQLLADSAADPALRPIAELTAGAPYPLTRKQLGGAGTRQFRADYAGDDSHQPASVVGSYELTSGSTTTLALDGNEVAFEDTLVATGTVVDEDGAALLGVVVALVAGDRRLAQGVTGAAGAYRFAVEGEILGVGQLTVQTVAEPGGSVQSSRSPPMMVRVAPPQPVPVTYTVIAFLATGLAAGAFFAGRSKPWRRFAKATPPAQQPSANTEAQEGGLVVARPGLVSTLRRASDTVFTGVVRDTVRGRAVAAATVVVRRAAAAAADDHGEPYAPPRAVAASALEQRTVCAADGSFAFAELGAGEWSVAVSAHAHVTESFTITVPHRGELRGVRVDLVPVREKVFLLYQRAALPALPDPKLWGVWSPRQVVDHVRSTRPSPALSKLTDFVEEVYFSARPLEETVLPTARRRVEAAIAERAIPG